MLSQVRVRCATTPCATLFSPQLPAVAAAHGDVQRLRVQAEEGLLLMQSAIEWALPHARIAGVGGGRRVAAASAGKFYGVDVTRLISEPFSVVYMRA
jgi:hypothetical protein